MRHVDGQKQRGCDIGYFVCMALACSRKNNRPLMLAGLLKLAPKAKFEIKSLHCSRWAGGLLKMYNREVSKGSKVFCMTGVVKIIVWC